MSAPIDPRTLAPSYARFLRPGRIFLTGHSHQAWPDAAQEGLLESFEDAAAQPSSAPIAHPHRGAMSSR